MTTEVRRLVASAVISELGRTGRDSVWLAERSGLSHRDVEASLAGGRDLTVAELAAIADALAVSPARLVPAPPSG
ncbi:helix-turn-helix domain-containing protein [Microbacterium hydrocarbonoxydans]|uniref:helix-turn-helix domain-containing protein n=1 Tax=Microbacterium hydrocarbonoxydans TaxID=273678 RepID=UPI00203BD488|nr:hypothetical protein [Microbacterium hydrocarbonoxydans]MCM3780141.1 hypothetical protein [Microbacterium hydrocarbonoxydans]